MITTGEVKILESEVVNNRIVAEMMTLRMDLMPL
jgi:hypothetical protein